MSLFTWFSKLFTPPALPSPQPRRRDRTRCEGCGKDIAIIASTGRLWTHTCVRPDQPEVDPDEFGGTHDTWDEHEGL